MFKEILPSSKKLDSQTKIVKQKQASQKLTKLNDNKLKNMLNLWEDCKFKVQWKTCYLFSIWLKLKREGTGVSDSSGGNANYSNSVFVQSVIKNYLKHDGLKTTKMYFAQFWRLGILKFPVYKQGQFLVKAFSWLAKYHLLHLNRERRWVNSGVPFIRALSSFIKTPPLWSHKSPFP